MFNRRKKSDEKTGKKPLHVLTYIWHQSLSLQIYTAG